MKILIKHQDRIFRFLAVEQVADGSLYCSVMRTEPLHGQSHSWSNDVNEFVPVERKGDAPRRISYHTTGRVNYHGLVEGGPMYFEPLVNLTRPNPFALISFPRVERLDLHDQSPAREDGIIEVLESTERLTFALAVYPLSLDGPPDAPWLRIAYEEYALFIQLSVMPMAVPDTMREHFIYGRPENGFFSGQRISKPEAELAFVQNGNGPRAIIYPPNANGVYTLFPSVVMRITPRVSVIFKKPGYEVLIDPKSQPHKVQFRIKDKGGFIKTRDLRDLIEKIELDAEL